jgi:hypothetical protein
MEHFVRKNEAYWSVFNILPDFCGRSEEQGKAYYMTLA